jgi:hypothetical protein
MVARLLHTGILAMPYIDTLLGFAGLGVALFAIIDNRRERNKREKALTAAREVLARTYGLLRGIKPAVNPTLPEVGMAIEDGLAEINQQRANLDIP